MMTTREKIGLAMLIAPFAVVLVWLFYTLGWIGVVAAAVWGWLMVGLKLFLDGSSR